MDEFGMGSHSVYSSHGPVRNAISQKLSAGGSSGGSAVAVATNQCFAALGTDTGGSVRLPAAYNSIVGFKPTYGYLSRWGLTAYANSLDTIGILAKRVEDVRDIFVCLKAEGESNDPTSIAHHLVARCKPTDARRSDPTTNKTFRIGVPTEYNSSELMPSVRAAWSRTLIALQDAGHSIHPISLPATRSALSAYYVLVPSEASSNLARYDGVRYGARSQASIPSVDDDVHNVQSEHADEHEQDVSMAGVNKPSTLFSNTRGQGLGNEVRRRILLGVYSLSAGAMDNYFIQAQKVRRQVQQDFDSVFAAANPLTDANEDTVSCTETPNSVKVDFVLTPTAQSLPPEIDEIQQRDALDAYSADVLTVPSSLAGLPAINVPVPLGDEVVGYEGVQTTGMQIIGQVGRDDEVLKAAEVVEQIFENQRG